MKLKKKNPALVISIIKYLQFVHNHKHDKNNNKKLKIRIKIRIKDFRIIILITMHDDIMQI